VSETVPHSLFVSSNLLTATGSANLTDRLFNGSLGARFRITDHSSLSIELRAFSYATKQPVNAVFYRDTTFDHSAQQYLNTIGTFGTSIARNTKTVYSIIAGYRQTIFANALMRPFVEVGAGLKTNGAQTSEKFGLEYNAFTPLSIELSLRSDQLLGAEFSGATLTGIEATIGYSW
jgi:hypothetical protein